MEVAKVAPSFLLGSCSLVDVVDASHACGSRWGSSRRTTKATSSFYSSSLCHLLLHPQHHDALARAPAAALEGGQWAQPRV